MLFAIIVVLNSVFTHLFFISGLYFGVFDFFFIDFIGIYLFTTALSLGEFISRITIRC